MNGKTNFMSAKKNISGRLGVDFMHNQDTNLLSFAKINEESG